MPDALALTAPTLRQGGDGLIRVAQFSACRTWRYTLERWWDLAREPLAVIGLNPSTADETQDDPTVRRCIRYARDWGYGGLVMLNLFAFRAMDPRDMKAAADPVGPHNDAALRVHTRPGQAVLCAWGAHGPFRDRAAHVRRMLADRQLLCLGLTQSGEPRHPLYLPANLSPTPVPGTT